jgi:hypothetical protein
MTEPITPLLAVPLTPPKQLEGVREAMQRAAIDLPELTRPGMSVSAQWVQGQGVSVALQVKVQDRITLAVVAEKTYDDLRVLGEVTIEF